MAYVPTELDEAMFGEVYKGRKVMEKTVLKLQEPSRGRLDPYVSAVLSQEPVETQRAVVSILTLLKSIVRGIEKHG